MSKGRRSMQFSPSWFPLSYRFVFPPSLLLWLSSLSFDHASYRELVSDGVSPRKADAHLHTQQPHVYTHRAHWDQQNAGRRNQARSACGGEHAAWGRPLQRRVRRIYGALQWHPVSPVWGCVWLCVREGGGGVHRCSDITMNLPAKQLIKCFKRTWMLDSYFSNNVNFCNKKKSFNCVILLSVAPFFSLRWGWYSGDDSSGDEP